MAGTDTQTPLATHQPCPDCGSSDALSIYEDHTWCFACSTRGEGGERNRGEGRQQKNLPEGLDKRQKVWYNILKNKNSRSSTLGTTPRDSTLGIEPKEKSLSINKYPIEEEIMNLSKNLDTTLERYHNRYSKVLSKKTLDKAGVTVNGNLVHYPYYQDLSDEPSGYKIRRLDQKAFFSEGNMTSPKLFLQGLIPGKYVTVTEGEDDALAFMEIQDSKYPVVSVTSSSNALRDCKNNFDYLNSFERIYLCFDSDEPGQKAVDKVAGLFNPNKVYHVRLNNHKDAMDYLEAGHKELLIQEWWNARPYLPTGIVGDYQSIEEILKEESNLPIADYPFKKLQDMTYGIRSSEVVLLTAQEKVGKVLSLDTRLPTPSGWTTIADLKVGDKLFSQDGTVTTVTYITPTHSRPYYRFVFSDGTTLDAGDNHRWTVRDLQGKTHVKTTLELLGEREKPVVTAGSKARWMVPSIRAVDLPEIDLPIDPFVLGVWLADGHSYSSNITLSPSKLSRMEGYVVTKISPNKGNCSDYQFQELPSKQLRDNNLLENKHIPSVYLRASTFQRQALFKGLCFDGWSTNGCNGKQENEFYSSNKTLFDQTVELARSLGYTVTCRSRQGRYKKNGVWTDCKTAYSFRYRTSDWKAIRAIKYIGPLEGRCLTVDHPSHLFAAGDGWTLTHNTEIMRAIEHHILKNTDYNIGIIHLEESEKRSVQGLVGYELKRPVHLPDSGLSNQDVLRAYRDLTKRDNRCYLYKHFGSDDPKIILETIRYLVAVCECKIIFLDHITMLVTGFEQENERKTLDYLSTQLAMMTRELDFTLFLVSHVNDDGKTRGSRNVSKVADLIIHLDRDIEANSISTRNKTHLMVKGNRFAGLSGPSSVLWFDQGTFTYSELDTNASGQQELNPNDLEDTLQTSVSGSDSGAKDLWIQTSHEKRQ